MVTREIKFGVYLKMIQKETCFKNKWWDKNYWLLTGALDVAAQLCFLSYEIWTSTTKFTDRNN